MLVTVFAKPRAAVAAEQMIQRLLAAEMARFSGRPTAMDRETPRPKSSRELQARRQRLNKGAAEIRADEKRCMQRRLLKAEAEIRADKDRLRGRRSAYRLDTK